jgi:hypothetical protein
MIWLILSGILIILLSVYLLLIRPRHMHWGAYDSEIDLKLPGDDLVGNPDFNATRGITINAGTEDIWKWIIQIGSGRAGWYSIDLIDNGGKPSSEIILPEFQKISAGQFIPFTPDQKNGMWVRDFRENNYILWTDKDGKAAWCWYLIQEGMNKTRLITRLRTRYNWTSIWIIYYLIYDFGDIIMMKKCMKGIKTRAEFNNRIPENKKVIYG